MHFQIPIPDSTLRRIGKALVECVVIEAKKDAVWSSFLPRDPSFFRSFRYRVREGSLMLYSTWPWIELAQTGKGRYKLTWLTREEGVTRVPLRDPQGRVIFRATPRNASSAWVHPGIDRHTFVQRGIQKAKRRISRILQDELGG